MTGDAVLILIVEDEPPIRRLLRTTLGAHDYRTVEAATGAEALTALRHRLQQQGTRPAFESGDLRVDLVHHHVQVAGHDVKLSPKEYDILEQMVIHAGKVLTHKHLLREVWGPAASDVQYLRIYIRQLRQKIEPDPERPTHIMTETGVGYRLRTLD